MRAGDLHWLRAAMCVLLVACGGPSQSDDDAGAGVDAAPPGDADISDTVDDDGDGFSENQGDCNDADDQIHPDATEICDDGVDNNCNGATDTPEPDADGDGIGPCQGDCDDGNDQIFPGQDEVANGIDDNCDGITDADYDSDGFAVADGDCNDNDADIHPDAGEDCWDTVDNDCDGFIDDQEPDGDGDGFGPCAGDCDDTDPNVNPGENEVPNNGIDDNCDYLVDQDVDGDGWTVANGDCQDTNASVNPSVVEVCSDGIDNDCDGTTDTDCLTDCDLAELTRSSVGCVYYAVDTNPMALTYTSPQYGVAVSNIDPVKTAAVTIEVKSGNTWSVVANGSFNVGPRALVSRVLPHRTVNGSAIYAGGAYRITSNLPVIAYQFNPMDGSTSFYSDASLLLPKSSLDTFYMMPAWPWGPRDQSSTSEFPARAIVAASAANTQVTVTSPVATVAGSGVPALAPNVPQTWTLQEGDYLQFQIATFGQSLNGLRVSSTQPVSLFSTNDCVNVPASASYCCCEHLEEQVFGLQTWGKTYVASRAPVRLAEPVIWQVMAQQNATTVSFDKNAAVTGLPAAPITLNAGQMVQYQVGGTAAHPGDFQVSADKPILVTQYMVGAFMVQSGGSNGDPSMMLTVPVEQYLSSYVVLVPGTWVNDFLVLTRTANETVSIDGNPVNTGWVQVGSTGRQVARVAVADGVHVLTGSAPFGVIVIGYDSYDSYGYPGGLNQQIINPMN